MEKPPRLLHLLGRRQRQLDSSLQDEVPPNNDFNNKLLIIKHNHSVKRSHHTAWTPQSLPNSIMLLGGWTDAADLTAVIVPGNVIRGKLSQADNISSQVETRLN